MSVRIITAFCVALTCLAPQVVNAGDPPRTDRVGDVLPEGAVVRFGTLRFRTPRRTTAMALSPDRKWLANGTQQGAVEIWDLETGRIVHQLQPAPPEDEEDEEEPTGPLPIADLAFGPGGKSLAAAVGNRAELWSMDPVEARAPLVAKSPLLSVAWANKGRTLLAAGADKEIYVWDPDSGDINLRLQGHTADITDLAMAGRGKLLVSVGRDGALRSFKAGGWGEAKLVETAAHGGSGIETVSASPDGKLVATGAADGKVVLWDVRRRRAVRTLEVALAPIDHVTFGPKGRKLAVCAGGKLYVYSKDGKSIHTLQTASATRATFDRSGDRVFTGGDGIEVFDLDTGLNLLGSIGHRGPVRALTYANGGKFVASGGDGDTVKVWEAGTGHELQSLSGHVGVLALAVSADSGRVVVGARSRDVHVWDLLQGNERARLSGHKGLVTAVAYGPEGGQVASGGTDAAVRVWNLETGQADQSFLGDRGHARSLAWSPDGRLLAGGLHRRWFSDDTESVVVWHVDTGSRQFRLNLGDTAAVAVSFSPDSKTLAVACADGSIRLIDTRSGTEAAQLDGHAGHVRTVNWSPDGKMLASGGNDGTVRLWDSASGKQLRKLEGHVSAVYAVAFAPSGAQIASASADSTVLIWELSDN